jgi:hypothetical protein
MTAGSIPFRISTISAKWWHFVNHEPIWLKIETTTQHLVTVSYTAFEEKLSNGRGAHTRSQTDGWTDTHDLHVMRSIFTLCRTINCITEDLEENLTIYNYLVYK